MMMRMMIIILMIMIRWGSGGRQENINAICVLALNMINDKVYDDNIMIVIMK